MSNQTVTTRCQFCQKNFPKRSIKRHEKICPDNPRLKTFLEQQPCLITVENSIVLKQLPITIQKKLQITYTCTRCHREIIGKLAYLTSFTQVCPSCRQADTTRQHNIEKYGVPNVMQVKEIFEKSRQTCRQNWNVDRPCQNEEIRKKMDETCQREYGYKRPNQNPDIQAKIKKSVQDKYGVDNVMQLESVKAAHSWYRQTPEQQRARIQKRRKTLIQNFGTDFGKEFSKKSQKTKELRYGDSNYSNKDRARETKLKKYGTLHPQKYLYTYDNEHFDSKPELIFWIYMKAQGKDIVRNKDQFFEYLVDDEKHFYYPDFIVDDVFYEIKGGQFRSKSGTWQNPFNHKLDLVFEAKRQCALKNSVIILYDDLDFAIYNKFIKDNYPKDFLKEFRKTK